MGGRGSGRWRYHSPKATVDQAMTLDANQLVRQGILRAGTDSAGILLFGSGSGSLGYVVTAGANAGRLALVYSVEGQMVAERLDVEASRPPFGGLRWWLRCPQEGCGRRVVKLHLRSGRSRFLCRLCHDLTYATCQRSHSMDSLCSDMAAQAGPGWTVSLMRRFLDLSRGVTYGRKRRNRLLRDLIRAEL
jgi:hypothetical protein